MSSKYKFNAISRSLEKKAIHLNSNFVHAMTKQNCWDTYQITSHMGHLETKLQQNVI